MNQVFERFRVPVLRPIMVAGVLLVVVAVVLTWAILLRPGSPSFLLKLPREDIYIVTGMIGPLIVFYLLTGLGVLFPSKWGYYLFRVSLYIHLFVGFPITTVFAYRGLSYIKDPSVKHHFGVPAPPHETTTLSHREKVTLVVIGAALGALWLWVMLSF